MPFPFGMADCEACGAELGDREARLCQRCSLEWKAEKSKKRRDQLKAENLCINARAHGAAAEGCAGRCRMCWDRKKRPDPARRRAPEQVRRRRYIVSSPRRGSDSGEWSSGARARQAPGAAAVSHLEVPR